MTSATFTITISAPAATGITITPVAPYGAPLPSGTVIAAGTVLGTIVVQPIGWTGGIGLSGTNANLFSIGGASPNYTLTAAVQISGSGTYTVTLTPAP